MPQSLARRFAASTSDVCLPSGTVSPASPPKRPRSTPACVVHPIAVCERRRPTGNAGETNASDLPAACAAHDHGPSLGSPPLFFETPTVSIYCDFFLQCSADGNLASGPPTTGRTAVNRPFLRRVGLHLAAEVSTRFPRHESAGWSRTHPSICLCVFNLSSTTDGSLCLPLERPGISCTRAGLAGPVLDFRSLRSLFSPTHTTDG